MLNIIYNQANTNPCKPIQYLTYVLMVLIDVVISFLRFKIVTNYNEKHPVFSR